MTTLTEYLWFNTKKRQEFIRITDDVAAIVKKSGVVEGMVLVSAIVMPALYIWREQMLLFFVLIALVYACYGTQLSVFASTTAGMIFRPSAVRPKSWFNSSQGFFC